MTDKRADTVRRYMSPATARRISLLPRTQPTNATHSEFDVVKTICRDCEQPIVEIIPKGDGRRLRVRCHRCIASFFRNVRIIQ